MADQFADQRRSIGDGHFCVSDLCGNHGLENGCLALDHQVAPATQLAKLIEASLHQDAIATAQDSLAAGQGVASAVAHHRENDHARRGADATLSQGLADQDRLARNTQHESMFMQLVARSQTALTDVFVALVAMSRQQEPADQGDEHDAE